MTIETADITLKTQIPVILPMDVPKRDEMTKEEFACLMEIGLQQAKNDDSFDIDEVFAELEAYT